MTTESKPPQRPPPRRGGRRGIASRKGLDADARKQLHELQVHQVELEMQNQELRRVRAELHASLTRYSALYEFAPVGYLMLGLDGSILERNQFAARLLGADQKNSEHARFGAFLVPASRQDFYTFLTSTLHTTAVQECEVGVQRPDGGTARLQVSATYQAGSQTYLVALTDVTAHHEALQRARDSEQETQRLLRENRDLTRRMFELLESDRRNIAREMHDELGQWLTAIQAATGAMIRSEYELQPSTRTSIRAINASVAEMHNVLRRILLRLRPTLLDTIGLTEGLRELSYNWSQRHKGIRCQLAMEGELSGLGELTDITLFRVVQEALTNVAKHAKAKTVNIRLERSETDRVSLEITDDGDGFDPSASSRGMGVLGMRERVIAAGGTFRMSSRPSEGLRIQVAIPVAPPTDGSDPSTGPGSERRDG